MVEQKSSITAIVMWVSLSGLALVSAITVLGLRRVEIHRSYPSFVYSIHLHGAGHKEEDYFVHEYGIDLANELPPTTFDNVGFDSKVTATDNVLELWHLSKPSEEQGVAWQFFGQSIKSHTTDRRVVLMNGQGCAIDSLVMSEVRTEIAKSHGSLPVVRVTKSQFAQTIRGMANEDRAEFALALKHGDYEDFTMLTK